MFGEGTTVIISAKEAMRNESTRLQVYKLAVQNGFYNESAGTIAYKGYILMQDGLHWVVMQNGMALIQLQNSYVARVWVTCRTNSCGLVEANRIVKAENLTRPQHP
jgi:hypothetical protein